MRLLGPTVLALCFLMRPLAAAVPGCSDGARTFLPCELRFTWTGSELPSDVDTYRDDTINVEFRSPNHKTYLMRAYASDVHTLSVRFSPTEPGAWTYHVTSPIKRYDDQEQSFQVADSGLPGFVSVANLRHWRTTNKQPHLWISATAPPWSMGSTEYESWLDARKKDGFTHIRFIAMTNGRPVKPILNSGKPNSEYFAALDARLLPAAQRGFVLDLILASSDFAGSGPLSDWNTRDPLMRYMVARYGGLNVTWQGIEHFEDVAHARDLLKGMAESLKKYDMIGHPCSTDARNSSSPLVPDHWMDFLIEASPHPELGAVEHQFTTQPEVHVVSSAAPDQFRHEIWNATTNGEYLSIPYQAIENPANAKAIAVWSNVISNTRHWELEPYFDVDGARAVGLNEVEYLAYADKPGVVEITLPKHKYNPVWVNPATGEELEMKDYRGEVFSQQTPGGSKDWVLQVPREGHKEMMLKYYYFESEDPPVQEPEVDPSKAPFAIVDPEGDSIHAIAPPPYSIKLTRANRASRTMQYVWWGEIVAGGEGARLLGIGADGTLQVPQSFQQVGAMLNVRLLAINANGKAYELDRVYQLVQ